MKTENYKKSFSLLLIWLFSAAAVSAQNDTLRPAKEKRVPVIKWKLAYHQTLTLKLFLSQAGYDGKYKSRDNDSSTVYLRIADAMEVIKKIDNLTLGIPKIIYLVGWQYNGHDSKYPAWFEGNERLKRPGDKNAIESIRWLMKEAKRYHTTVSLHINMFDAYEDSPLWKEYVAHDIIAKNKDGSLRSGEWGYPISYAQEWKTGFAQKRIDSLCKLLPVQEAGTIHIDAFHTWPPIPSVDSTGKSFVNLGKGPTSPYLKFTVQDETKAQVSIFNYWASKGIDVTSEGVDFLRETDFAGLQPMAWWFTRSPQEYLDYPASFYTGGVDRDDWGKLFGSSMHGEQEIKEDTVSFEKFLGSFCMNTLPWYYLNRLERKYAVEDKDFKKAVFSGNVESGSKSGRYYLLQNKDTLASGDDLLIPALWTVSPSVIAFSRNGYENREWKLPTGFGSALEVDVYSISAEGQKFLHKVKADKGFIRLSVPAGKGFLLRPGGSNKN